MKISRNWLSDYVDLSDLSAEELEDLVTTKIAEVDDLYESALPLKQAKAGLVESAVRHSEKSELQVACVNLGDARVTVVSGAPDLKTGTLVAYVPPGGEIVDPVSGTTKRIETKSIFGVESQGVLVSEAELGLTNSHEGLFVLDSEYTPGSSLRELPDGLDWILEVDNKSLTHRPDLWGHFGFAREIAAVLHRPLKRDLDIFADNSDGGKARLEALGTNEPALFSILIDKRSQCRRFSTIGIANVTVAPSPLWLRRRLFSIGAGVRNQLVDISNYVMHDTGQPNHVYDAKLLKGPSIIVRPALNGEKFLSLDGVERSLTEEDVVIADATGPVALGGIIGGLQSSVQENTTTLILESANFEPTSVRLAAKRHQLRTDASNRFEKGQSPFQVPLALHRYFQLINRCQPEATVFGAVSEDYPEPPRPLTVFLDGEFVRERLGKPLSDDEIVSQLESLGFEFAEDDGRKAATVPYFRATRDISIPEDLIEEVGRLEGYSTVPTVAPLVASTGSHTPQILALEDEVRSLLLGAGFLEIYDYSTTSKEAMERCGFLAEDAIELENPVDTTENLLRTSLIPGMVRAIRKNQKHETILSLFEVGRSYHRKSASTGTQCDSVDIGLFEPVKEKRLLSLGYGGIDEKSLASASKPSLEAGDSFYAALSLIRRLVRLVSTEKLVCAPLSGEASSSTEIDVHELKAWMHPYRSGVICLGGKPIGLLAEVHPRLLEGRSRYVVAEIDLEVLLSLKSDIERFKKITRFPVSFFEISVVTAFDIPFSELERLFTSNIDPSLLRSLEPVAIYKGKPLNENEKSTSIRFAFGAEDRTLSGEEVNELQQRILRALEKSSFKLRS